MATSDFITIPLTKGYSTIISIEDEDLSHFNWSTTINGKCVYAQRTINYKKVYLHHVIFSRIIGRVMGKGDRVDHIDTNGLNNTRSNLRLTTHSQNLQNRGMQKNNTTGYKGVSKKDGRYRASICVNGIAIHLGTYKTPEEAHQAYCDASLLHHKEYGRIK